MNNRPVNGETVVHYSDLKWLGMAEDGGGFVESGECPPNVGAGETNGALDPFKRYRVGSFYLSL